MSTRRSAKAWQFDRKCRETVEEVLTKFSARGPSGKIHIAGGEHTHIDSRHFGSTPDAGSLFVPESAATWLATSEGKFAHLIQEQCAAVGRWDPAELRLDRASERSAGKPNSSDSSEATGIAAQFTTTQRLCRARAQGM